MRGMVGCMFPCLVKAAVRLHHSSHSHYILMPQQPASQPAGRGCYFYLSTSVVSLLLQLENGFMADFHRASNTNVARTHPPIHPTIMIT